MPAPSAFVARLRSRGIGSRDVHHGWRDGMSITHLAERGKHREAVAAEFAEAPSLTRELLAAPVPRARSTLSSRALYCSDYASLSLKHSAASWRVPETCLAIVHLEFGLEVGANVDPRDRAWAQPPPPPQVLLTVRLLDAYLPPPAGNIDQAWTLDRVAEAVFQEAYERLGGVVDALYDLHADEDESYWEYPGLVRIALQGRPENAQHRLILGETEQWFAHATHDSAGEVGERLLPSGETFPVEHVGPDANYERALAIALRGRAAFEKPKLARAEPNGMHHLLIRSDPVLRICGDRVTNLAAMAALQTTADENRAKRVIEDYGLDEDDDRVDWGPGFEARLARMKANPKHQAVKWVFIVDDGTGAFAAVPIPATELDVDRLVAVLDAIWAGEHGVLRGPPKELSVPAAYATQEAREQIQRSVASRAVALVHPKSGFGTPIHVTKVWCEASRTMKKYERALRNTWPATFSWAFVQAWAYAHALGEHAHSFFENEWDDPMRGYMAFYGSGYAAMKTIQVRSYLASIGEGDPVAYLTAWNAKCHKDFQSGFAVAGAPKPSTASASIATRP